MQGIIKHASVKNVMILLLLVIAINIVFSRVFADNPEISPLDLQFYYTSQEAYEILSRFDDKELQKYQLIELTLDMLYPLVYSLMFCFILILLYKNIKMAMLPFLTAIFDVFENLGIVILILNLPKQLDLLASITGVFTLLKWFSFIVVIIFTLAGILKWIAGIKRWV